MDVQTLLLLFSGLLLAVLVLLVVLLLRRSGGRGDQAAEGRRLADELASERERLRSSQVDAGELRGRLEALQAEKEGLLRRTTAHEQEATALAARLQLDAAGLAERDARLVERERDLRQLEAQRDRLEQALQALQAEHQQLQNAQAQALANLEHSERARAELRTYLDTAQEKLSGAFAELAGKVFEERGQQFAHNVRVATAQSRTDIEGLLKPFAERLNEFRTRVDAVYGEEARERASLAGAVGELKTLNQEMAAQASALTRALKGSAKVRGDWGELMLDNVLRGSGLEEGVHYQRQVHAVDDEGDRLRPDVVVRLPDERSVAVDSKVNLIAWQEAMNAETPEQHDDALRRHAVALRQHVRELGEKNYPKALGGDALEVTVAFVPIEGALSAALGADGGLQTYAFDQRVVFASPNTLMALLRVVERLWTRDKVQKQALEISRVGGLVLDALSAFVFDFNLVDRKLADARKAFDDARNHLLESPQSAIVRARRLSELGAKAKRALPGELQPEEVVRQIAAPGEAPREAGE
ncbi:DNA recombination protein RmuC [Luteimonas marina]|uniref:DNA recombination protein RmuC n=1 Tax=Luteimonas marina TaxID=488485 RepID=A0A5C5TZC4_9GAMM|nr:DNA recombination protein RmuC [Luteimonas marina]TWT19413.1 DNA recombination protein RmuC [Luteimonas marina]